MFTQCMHIPGVSRFSKSTTQKKNADRKQDNQAMITIQSTVCKNVYPTILVSVVCMCILLHVLVEDVIHKQYEDLLIIFVSFKVIVKSLGAFKS